MIVIGCGLLVLMLVVLGVFCVVLGWALLLCDVRVGGVACISACF